MITEHENKYNLASRDNSKKLSWHRGAGFFILRGYMRKCSVDGCNNKHHCKGFCNFHYYRFRTYGKLFTDIPKGKRIKKKHGQYGSRLYWIWTDMKARCSNKKSTKYKYYGARGIKVCELWINSFNIFAIWAKANGYRNDLQIDRENNNGNYCPENCRFVTPAINSQNKRNIKLNPDAVRLIRSHIGDLKFYEEMAVKYNTHITNIKHVANMETWKNI